LGRFASSGEPFTGVVADGRVGRVTDLLPEWQDTGIVGLFDDWDVRVAHIGAAVRGGAELSYAESELTRLTPLAPRQLFGAGMNYRKHVVDLMVDSNMHTREEAEAVMDERAASGTPFVFMATPTAVCGPDD